VAEHRDGAGGSHIGGNLLGQDFESVDGYLLGMRISNHCRGKYGGAVTGRLAGYA
jgi:hypothetical protein